MALCEAAAYYKNEGLTLWDQMINIYEKYGFYKEGQIAITMKGIDGAEKIKAILENLRKNPPKTLANYDVIETRDYESGIIQNCLTQEESTTGLPKSNVLYYDLQDNAWCCVRPSGTEPKIKFYIGVKGNSLEDADNKLQELTDAVKKFEN